MQVLSLYCFRTMNPPFTQFDNKTFIRENTMSDMGLVLVPLEFPRDLVSNNQLL